MKNKLDIIKIIDINKIQILMDSFCKTIGIASSIVDLDANIICSSNWHNICSCFHRINPDTSSKCMKNQIYMNSRLNSGEKYIFTTCPNGLIDMACPIFLEGKHIADLVIGQFLTKSPDMNKFRSQAAQYGFNEKLYINTLKNIPILTEEKVKFIMQYMINFSDMLGHLLEVSIEKIKSEDKFQKLGQYKKLVDGLGDKFVIFRMTYPDGKLTYVSPSINLLYGIRPEDAVGYHWTHIMKCDENDITKANNAIEYVANGRKIYPIELTHNCSNGSKRTFLISCHAIMDDMGVVTALEGLSVDITERKHTEEILHDNEECLSMAAKASRLGMWTWNTEDESADVSNEWLDIAGITREVFLQSNNYIANNVHPEDQHRYKKILSDFVSGKSQKYESGFRFFNPKKGWIFIYSVGSALKQDADGHVLRMVGFYKDVTEEKKLIKELQRAKETADKANKAKSIFLANMSHEIRTPLSAVIGLCTLLLKSELNDNQMDYAKKMYYSAENLLGTVNNILDFSKIEADKLQFQNEEFDLFELMDMTINILSQSIQAKNLKLKVSIDESVPLRLVGDVTRIGQVILNLANNAVKFTTHGFVSISVNLISMDSDTASILFSVRDTGIGIPEQQKKNLFHAFSQADSSTSKKFGGTGLGLAISNGIIDKMNGSIRLESQKGLGTTVSFCIPVKFLSENETYTMGKTYYGKKACIISDDHEMSSNLKRILSLLGFEITALNEYVDAAFIDLSLLTKNQNAFKNLINLFDHKNMNIFSISSCDTEIVSSYLYPNINIKKHLMYPIGLNKLNDILKQFLIPDQISLTHNIPENILEQIKILVVEDNEINMLVARECLCAEGFNVKEASNGRLAVKYAENEDFDIILMDLHMPVMDGFMTAEKIRKLKSEHPPVIIALTADAEQSVLRRAINSGMDDYLTKPFDYASLMSTVKRWIRVPDDCCAADTAKATPDKMLPEQPDVLDVNSALARLNGDKDCYIELLELFKMNNEADVCKIEQSLESGSYEQALRLLHTLKGISGNLGAISIQNAAAKLEYDLKNNVDIGQYKKHLKSLEHCFHNTFMLISEILNSKKSKSFINVDKLSDLNEKLENLQLLIEMNDVAALELFNELSPYLFFIYSENTVNMLKNALLKFDWDASIALLKKL